MINALHRGLSALVVIAACAAPAQALDLKQGAEPKLRPTSIQLGIISPPGHVCPGPAKLTVWVRTNKPGTIDILIVRKNGQVAGPYPVTTSKGANGAIMGSYSMPMNIATPIDAEYRVVVAGTPVVSNWAPLRADC